MEVLSLSKGSRGASSGDRLRSLLEPAESSEPVEGAACTIFHLQVCPKSHEKDINIPIKDSFLHTEKYPVILVSATQSATNRIPPAEIERKSRKVAKNDPIAGISRDGFCKKGLVISAFAKPDNTEEQVKPPTSAHGFISQSLDFEDTCVTRPVPHHERNRSKCTQPSIQRFLLCGMEGRGILAVLMKKTFPLHILDKADSRVIAAIKVTLNKYVKRERGKAFPEGADCWDFECRVGVNSETAQRCELAEIPAGIDAIAVAEHPEVYVEILAKPGQRHRPEAAIPAEAGKGGVE